MGALGGDDLCVRSGAWGRNTVPRGLYYIESELLGDLRK